jgi:hypothetical protein
MNFLESGENKRRQTNAGLRDRENKHMHGSPYKMAKPWLDDK